MIFDLSNCSQRTVVKKMVQQIAEMYVQKLTNQFVFKAKLEQLTVIPFDIPVSQPYAFIKISRYPVGTYTYSIVIVYNSRKFNPMYVAYAIAHEFGHFLVFSPVDCLRNIHTGKDLEEAIADYLAYYVLADAHYPDKSASFKKRCDMKIPQNKRRAIEDLEKHFGKPLFDCEKIDEITEKNKKANIFWYNVVTFNWENTKALFHKKTGENFKKYQDSLKEIFHEPETEEEGNP